MFRHKKEVILIFSWKSESLDHYIKWIKSDSEKQMSDIYTCLRFLDFILVNKTIHVRQSEGINER